MDMVESDVVGGVYYVCWFCLEEIVGEVVYCMMSWCFNLVGFDIVLGVCCCVGCLFKEIKFLRSVW